MAATFLSSDSIQRLAKRVGWNIVLEFAASCPIQRSTIGRPRARPMLPLRRYHCPAPPLSAKTTMTASPSTLQNRDIPFIPFHASAIPSFHLAFRNHPPPPYQDISTSSIFTNQHFKGSQATAPIASSPVSRFIQSLPLPQVSVEKRS